MSITVGQASGVIALAVLITQIILPLAIVIVLVSLVQDSNNAATWSVISRSVQASWWPAIFRADSAATHHVSRRIVCLSWLTTLCLILLGVAGIMTPLGLSDIVQAQGTITPTFQYVPDPSPFGYGTPPRYNRFSRFCGYLQAMNCPGRDDGVTTTVSNGSTTIDTATADAYWNTSIPQNLTHIFSDATFASTLSGAFDIQYRSWEVGLDYNHISALPKVDRGLPYSRSAYRSMDSVILHNKIEALEGVIVDTVEPGLGYRNHSLPKSLALGGRWSEDLTWISPETECVDTNLTFEITTGDFDFNISSVDLIDAGGFVDSPRRMPFLDQFQAGLDLDLPTRALQGAYMSGSLLMFYFNVSFPNNTGPRNTSFGRRFPLRSQYKPNLYGIALSELQPSFLDFSSQPHLNDSTNYSTSAQAKLSVSDEDWRDVQRICDGGPGIRQPNISEVLVKCGYLYGAPQPLASGDPRIFQPLSKYNQSLYVCASGVRASIKTVDFSINGSATLDNLLITRLSDKTYKDNASTPLWGMEKTYRGGVDAEPVWGLVTAGSENATDIFAVRTDKFRLPGSGTDLDVTIGSDSLASASVYASTLISTYTRAAQSIGTGGGKLLDYSGSQNIALNRLWQTLSQSPSTASKIINLICTEILATATVGTKSAADTKLSTPIQVAPYERQLQYKLAYAIPAFIVLAIALLIVIALLFCLFTRFSIQTMSQLLNQTSTGRIVTNLLYPEICETDASAKAWSLAAGDMKLQYPFTNGPVSSKDGSIRQDSSGISDNATQEAEGASQVHEEPKQAGGEHTSRP